MIQCLNHTSNWPYQNARWNVGVSLNFGEVWTPSHQWLRLWMHGNMGHVAAAAPIMQLETLHRAFFFLAGPAGTCDSTCVLVDWNRRPATHHNSAITYCQCSQWTLALLKTDTCLTVFSRTTWVSQHQKSQTILDFNEARVDGGGSGISWTICRSFAARSRQITTPAPHHSIFTAGCSSWRSTYSIKALKISAFEEIRKISHRKTDRFAIISYVQWTNK